MKTNLSGRCWDSVGDFGSASEAGLGWTLVGGLGLPCGFGLPKKNKQIARIH